MRAVLRGLRSNALLGDAHTLHRGNTLMPPPGHRCNRDLLLLSASLLLVQPSSPPPAWLAAARSRPCAACLRAARLTSRDARAGHPPVGCLRLPAGAARGGDARFGLV